MSRTVQNELSLYPLPGPGLLIVLSSSGWVGLLSLISFGADGGYELVGITVLTLLYKYSILTGIGRYTLSSGQDIFAGIGKIPGPSNWAIWMLNCIYFIEIFMLGYSSLVMARLINNFFNTLIPLQLITFLIFLLIFFLLSLNSYWIFRRILLLMIFLILIGFCLMMFSMPVPVQDIISALIPDINSYFYLSEISVILSSVGSGLSILFFSIWLGYHLQGRNHPEDKKSIYRLIKLDAGIGMVLLFFICLLYYSVGYLFLYEHGLGAPEADLTLEIVLMVMNLGLFQNHVFMLICLFALFCSAFGGLYGRAHVLRVTLPRTIPGLIMTKQVFFRTVFFLSLAAICSQYFWSVELSHEFISLRLVVMGLITGILMIVDRQLPRSDRGSVIWYLVMGIGGTTSILIGLHLLSLYFG